MTVHDGWNQKDVLQTSTWQVKAILLLILKIFYYSLEEEATPDGAVAEYRREKQKYEALRKQQSKKGTSREDQTLALLNQFKSKLTQAIAETPENDIPETEVEDDEGWMSHVLQFEDKSRKVKDASMQDSDTFEIYDPRNPVNKRRREESKKLMREKKERR
nr:peptidyl-prolyl cis-trans isomerase CWC27 homolog [Macaca nemestrina]